LEQVRRRGNWSPKANGIFEDGIPDANVAACAACDGPVPLLGGADEVIE
jgi:hypothetical protein